MLIAFLWVLYFSSYVGTFPMLYSVILLSLSAAEAKDLADDSLHHNEIKKKRVGEALDRTS